MRHLRRFPGAGAGASRADERADLHRHRDAKSAARAGGRGGRGNRFGKVFGRAAGDALWYVPGGRTLGTAAARAAAVAGARAVAEVAATTRAHDELRLEYRIDTVDGRPFLKPKTEQAKAKSDGEDLLTPLVEKAAEAVAAALK